MTAAQFAAALSLAPEAGRAAREAADAVASQLDGPPDLALLFFTRHHDERAGATAEDVLERTGAGTLIGCGAEGVVGGAQEIEQGPGLSLWAARLPDSPLRVMRLQHQRLPDGHVIVGWPEELTERWPDDALLLLLADPFSFPAEMMLEQLNEDRPGAIVAGGMASGGAGPDGNVLVCGAEPLTSGAVAVLIENAGPVRTLVSQGCRPIGRPLVVTKAEGQVIRELGGRRALLQLKEIYDTLPNCEKRLVQEGLHLGRVVDERREEFQQGDFLVRNVMGVDPDEGAIAVGDRFRVGQTVQFHIRDRESADAELRQLLEAAAREGSSAAGLLFTCNGRGRRLFEQPNHDAGAIQRALGEIPLAGFFAQGEIGPVGGRNFLHGFTASLVLWGERTDG